MVLYRFRIRIHDSYKFIPHYLNSIAKDMLNIEGTDIFPHSFFNKNTIGYNFNTRK